MSFSGEGKIPARIRVRRGSECVLLAPGTPTLSSALSPWQGALLERHTHGPYTADNHQHLSYFLCLHLSEAAPLSWQSRGKAGSKMIGPGSIILLSRGTEDSVTFPKPVERILVNLEPLIFQRAMPDRDSARELELVDQWGIEDRQIEHILRALEADLEAGFPTGKLFGDSLLTALAAHLLVRYGVRNAKDAGLGTGLPKARLNRVLDYVEANLDRDIALSALAETAGMSPHYFSEMFKRSTTLSPHQYVLRRRIERARKLLRDPHVTVFEAAVRSGFSEPSHFTKIFRRIVGVTPTRYRAVL